MKPCRRCTSLTMMAVTPRNVRSSYLCLKATCASSRAVTFIAQIARSPPPTPTLHAPGIQVAYPSSPSVLLFSLNQPFTMSQVQKAAAEVSGKLPPRLTLPGIISTLNRFSESVETGTDSKKLGAASTEETDGDDELLSPGTLAAVSNTP